MDEVSTENRPVVVELTEDDIPGAALSEPLDSHTMPALKWWLLCRGIKVPSSWKKTTVDNKVIQYHCY